METDSMQCYDICKIYDIDIQCYKSFSPLYGILVLVYNLGGI